MTRLARDEGGFTLIELLVAMSIMTVVLGATLTAFTDFTSADHRNDEQNDAQDRARVASDGLARELRNLASPTNELPQAVDKAEPYDLVFKAADPVMPAGSLNSWNTRRIRYCLDAANPSDEQLWMQTQTWTSATVPDVPATVSCPDPAWSTQTLVADKLTNREAGRDRPVFYYLGGSALEDITGVRTNLFVDVNPNASPAEVHLSSGVFLRNQNRVPKAAFDVTVKPGALVFNGSASEDPEGDNLRFEWYVGPVKVGDGVVFNYPVTGPKVLDVTLKVYDPAGLEGVAGPEPVNVP